MGGKKGGFAGGSGGILGSSLGGLGGTLGGALGMVDGKSEKGSYIAMDPSLGRVTEAARAGQETAIGKFKDIMGQDGGQIADSMISQQERQARSLAGDVERQASQLTAQRGLGNSSVGLNAILNARRGLGDQISDIRTQRPGLARAFNLENVNTATQGLNSILGSQGAQRTFQQGYRGEKGSALPVLGLFAQTMGAIGKQGASSAAKGGGV